MLGPGIAGLFVQGIETGLVLAQWFSVPERSKSSVLSAVVIFQFGMFLVGKNIVSNSARRREYAELFLTRTPLGICASLPHPNDEAGVCRPQTQGATHALMDACYVCLAFVGTIANLSSREHRVAVCAVCVSVFYIQFSTARLMIWKLYVLSLFYNINAQPLGPGERPTTICTGQAKSDKLVDTKGDDNGAPLAIRESTTNVHHGHINDRPNLCTRKMKRERRILRPARHLDELTDGGHHPARDSEVRAQGRYRHKKFLLEALGTKLCTWAGRGHREGHESAEQDFLFDIEGHMFIEAEQIRIDAASCHAYTLAFWGYASAKCSSIAQLSPAMSGLNETYHESWYSKAKVRGNIGFKICGNIRCQGNASSLSMRMANPSLVTGTVYTVLFLLLLWRLTGADMLPVNTVSPGLRPAPGKVHHAPAYSVSSNFPSSPIVALVAQPPPLPQEVKQCTIPILHPEVVHFTFAIHAVPESLLTPVSVLSSLTSNGAQYDRLKSFTFQNVEIWRTSTPEPVKGDGIIWTYLKDVTRFIPLFFEPRTFLQLDNVVETGLNGECASEFFSYTPAIPPGMLCTMSLTTRIAASSSLHRSSWAPPSSNASSRARGGSLNIAPTGNAGSHWISNNTFDYYDTAVNTYTQQVNASRNVITFDSQRSNPASNAIANRLIVVSPARADMKAWLPGGRSNAITATQAPI
ncbi:hypothetical protein EDB84DRAFT_1437872 [Lactarius hengduanensis]|nr:hypothetical protein EDB84DRAFT_1437872 [Lactarius hengduanensis]